MRMDWFYFTTFAFQKKGETDGVFKPQPSAGQDLFSIVIHCSHITTWQLIAEQWSSHWGERCSLFVANSGVSVLQVLCCWSQTQGHHCNLSWTVSYPIAGRARPYKGRPPSLQVSPILDAVNLSSHFIAHNIHIYFFWQYFSLWNPHIKTPSHWKLKNQYACIFPTDVMSSNGLSNGDGRRLLSFHVQHHHLIKEAGVMNVEWMSEIDMLKAYPRAAHDSPINRNGWLGFLEILYVLPHTQARVLCRVCVRLLKWQLLYCRCRKKRLPVLYYEHRYFLTHVQRIILPFREIHGTVNTAS